MSPRLNELPFAARKIVTAAARRFCVQLFGSSVGRVALALLLISTLAVVVLTPRPTYPRMFPFPSLDRRRLAEIDGSEVFRAKRAREQLLPLGTRTVGELFRRAGRGLLTPAAGESPLFALVAEARAELSAGRSQELLRLRSLQSQLFVEAVRRYKATGEAGVELQELGGDFAASPFGAVAKESGEAPRDATVGPQPALEDWELRLLFRVRWGTLAGLHGAPGFRPSLDELRAYYALYLRAAGSLAEPEARALSRLAYARALGRVDSAYPVQLASGILLLQAGRRPEAARELAEHLRRTPVGAYALAARNYLLEALRER